MDDTTYFRLTLFATALLTSSECLDTNQFLDQVHNLANNILGAEKYQDYLDNHVTYRETGQTAEDILEQLSSDLAYKLNERITAVTSLRDKIAAEFESFTSTSTFDDCCDCCNTNGDQAAYLRFHSEDIDLGAMCHTGEGAKPSTSATKNYPNRAVFNRMRQNFEENPNLKWQYFGGEGGIMTIYPGNKACDDKFDPRYRPWYSHTAFPTPKDVVLVIDRSTSMTAFHGDRQLISIAQEAAVTVIDTLNPDDRVGVVYFSSQADTPRGCHASMLAQATSENKVTLKDYVESEEAYGNTDYASAFIEAFQMMHEAYDPPEFDSRDRVKVILFLTDGMPNKENYLDHIREENSLLNNSVTILTFGFGTGIQRHEERILEEIARQEFLDPAAGPIPVGEFVHVTNPDNLRYNMARFYDFFSSRSVNIEVTVSIPYLDAFGLGLITSICLPVHTSNTFRGVTCIDITISDLFSDATFFSQNGESYAVVMDSQTRLIVHPLLPRPSDVFDHPVHLRMLDIEFQTEVEDIVKNYILQGLAGNSSFLSRRVFARGDSEHDGVNTALVDSVYTWKPLGRANLVLCVVLGSSPRTEISGSLGSLDAFPYHRLDLSLPPYRCRYIKRMAITDDSTIKFSPFAFSSPDYYLETEETTDVISTYHQYFFGTGDAPFQSGVEKEVIISRAFYDSISLDENAWQSSVWRYLGLREGVFRLYPGAKLVKKYDHTVRPWYKRAVAQKSLVTFSKPYVDAFGAGIVVTLSKAVIENSEPGSGVAGCVGMDFTLDLFSSLVSSYISACQSHKCFVIDNGGYIVVHPDFEGTKEDEAGEIENLHISQKEEDVARILVDNGVMARDGCINYNNRQAQTFWRISPDDFTAADKFEMKYIPGTNIFVVHILSNFDTNGCRCPERKGLQTIPQCTNYTYICECPCYSRSDVHYDACTTKFTFNGEEQLFPPCTPPTPKVNLSTVEIEEREAIKQLYHCYPVEKVCPTKTPELNCSATAGCIWCGKCGVREDDGCEVSRPGGFLWPVLVVASVIVLTLLILYCLHKKHVICHDGKMARRSPREGVAMGQLPATAAGRPPEPDRSAIYATEASGAFEFAEPAAPALTPYICEPPPDYTTAMSMRKT